MVAYVTVYHIIPVTLLYVFFSFLTHFLLKCGCAVLYQLILLFLFVISKIEFYFLCFVSVITKVCDEVILI